MNHVATDLRTAVIASVLMVTPLAVLEALNTTLTKQNVTGILFLFALLLVLPVIFVLLVLPTIRALRGPAWQTAHLNVVVLKISLALLVAVIWGGLVIDQLPCFLGIPNCD